VIADDFVGLSAGDNDLHWSYGFAPSSQHELLQDLAILGRA
jgi:hypothetical protein